MRKLKIPWQGVPDDFRYTHPETGHVTTAVDVWTWLEKAKEHLKGNNLPEQPELFDLMQEQLCSTLPPEYCSYEQDDAGKQWINTRISFSDVIDFTKVLIAHAKTGGEYVSQEEADRRARICAACYLNVNVGGCGGCGQLVDLVTESRSTPHDHLLKSCAVCHCYNKSQVHFPLATLEINDTPERQSQYPPTFCWKSQKSPEYRP